MMPQKLNAEANLRIHLSSINPDIKEIYKNFLIEVVAFSLIVGK